MENDMGNGPETTASGAAPHEAPAPDTPTPSHEGQPPKPETRKKRMSLIATFVDAMEKGPTGKTRPFPRSFRVIEDDMGRRRPIELAANQVVHHVARECVETAIYAYSHEVCREKAPLLLQPHEVSAIYDSWSMLQKPLPEAEILAVRELNERGYTWHRLPWDIAEDGQPTPTFDELIARTDNGTALMAWIGSLLVSDSPRQQYVYIHGEGQNGKGRLSAFLKDVFAQAYRAEHIAKDPGPFWTSGLIGARLVVFPDFDNPRFPNSGFFKTLTGEDAVRVEIKGGASFTTELCCKVMFLGNAAPQLDDNAANRRRAIYCRVLPLAAGTKLLSPRAYGSRMWAEGPAWLAKCKRIFAELAGESGRIPTCDESLTNIIDANQEPLLHIVESWFDLSVEGETSAFHMQEVLQKTRLFDTRAQGEFFTMLEQRFGIRKVRKRGGDTGTRERVYRGLSVKEARLKGLPERF